MSIIAYDENCRHEAVSKIRKIFTVPTCKLLLSFASISNSYRSFIGTYVGFHVSVRDHTWNINIPLNYFFPDYPIMRLRGFSLSGTINKWDLKQQTLTTINQNALKCRQYNGGHFAETQMCKIILIAHYHPWYTYMYCRPTWTMIWTWVHLWRHVLGKNVTMSYESVEGAKL